MNATRHAKSHNSAHTFEFTRYNALAMWSTAGAKLASIYSPLAVQVCIALKPRCLQAKRPGLVAGAEVISVQARACSCWTAYNL